jgi:hypothetical protein
LAYLKLTELAELWGVNHRTLVYWSEREEGDNRLIVVRTSPRKSYVSEEEVERFSRVNGDDIAESKERKRQR